MPFWQNDADNWHIKDPTPVSPNTISAILTSGNQQWILIGSYISPTDALMEHLHDITSIWTKHLDLAPIILGDLNANLVNPRTPRDVNIATLMAQY